MEPPGSPLYLSTAGKTHSIEPGKRRHSLLPQPLKVSEGDKGGTAAPAAVGMTQSVELGKQRVSSPFVTTATMGGR